MANTTRNQIDGKLPSGMPFSAQIDLFQPDEGKDKTIPMLRLYCGGKPVSLGPNKCRALIEVAELVEKIVKLDDYQQAQTKANAHTPPPAPAAAKTVAKGKGKKSKTVDPEFDPAAFKAMMGQMQAMAEAMGIKTA